jgi:hypothetical protein
VTVLVRARTWSSVSETAISLAIALIRPFAPA